MPSDTHFSNGVDDDPVSCDDSTRDELVVAGRVFVLLSVAIFIGVIALKYVL